MSPMELDSIKVIADDKQLFRCGICRVAIPRTTSTKQTENVTLINVGTPGATTLIDWKGWARTLSTATLDNMGFEGDGQYAFYRNIMDEVDFPFDAILNSDIGVAIVRHFGLQSLDEIRLDDAFCVHYNSQQEDSSGAKHTDPSDITLNLCLERSSDVEGSEVMFYGTKTLTNLNPIAISSSSSFDDHQDRKFNNSDGPVNDKDNSSFRFLVRQEEGYSTIHWGDHMHETLPLTKGQRTNIVMTFLFKDPSRSGASRRTCYHS